MGKVAVDFGTCNTLLARFSETLQQPESIEIPGITTEMRYRFEPGAPEQSVQVTPSLIHYSESEILIGDQVLSRGLAEHPDTFRWMKRTIVQGNTRRKKTAKGFKCAAEAGEDFLRLLLNYATDRISFQDEFTFTKPIEAFEDYQDWLLRVAEGLQIQRVRLLDEPTACVFGYHGAAGQNERFVVFDFGGGTTDVSAVRLDMSPGAERKAIQLGQAGRELGGMDIDLHLADDFCRRHDLDADTRRKLDAFILRQVEEAKKRLSDPMETDASVTIVRQTGRTPRVHQTSYVRSCAACECGQTGQHPEAGLACLGCILLNMSFARQAREVLEQALENAAVKVGMRRDDVTRVLVTGGTALVPCVRKMLEDQFGGRVAYDHPFDTVVRGACRGIVEPILQHDYAIRGLRPDKRTSVFKPLFKMGTEYPTERDAVRICAKGAYNGMTRIGLKIFEVSRMKRRSLTTSIYGADGSLSNRVDSEYEYICLNDENPTFIIADPPINMARDQQRFLCFFQVDARRQLLVTVLDNLKGRNIMENHPVVRL